MFGVLPVADSPEAAHIILVNLKTRALTPLEGSEGICCPRWSPDGRWVIALSADNQKLMLFDMSTRKVAPVGGEDGHIWLHDLVVRQ